MEKILILPHQKLRQTSLEINEVGDKEIEISKKMIETMRQAPGVGLAANQIGILKKIVTIGILDEKTNKEIIYSLFNPIITSYSKEKIIMEEGCLSLPKQFAEIERPKSIEIQYINEKNKVIKAKKDGYEARVLQHEIDHLSGKLFIDYLSPLKRNFLIKKLKKMKKIGEV